MDVDPLTFRVKRADGERIYALGDVANAFRPAIHLITPALPVLGANLKRDLLLAAGMDEATAGTERKYAEDKRETQIVPVGQNKTIGVAMGYRLPGLLAWFLKGRDYWLWTTPGL